MENTKKADRKKSITGIVVVITVVAFLFVPIIPVDATYTETEPYNRLAKYEVVSATLTQEIELFGRGVYHRSTIVVKNIDSLGGMFKITHMLFGPYGSEGINQVGYIEAGSTRDFMAEFDTYQGQEYHVEYSVTAPTVTDQRVVTKHKTVYKSIIELMIYG